MFVAIIRFLNLNTVQRRMRDVLHLLPLFAVADPGGGDGSNPPPPELVLILKTYAECA